jgi:hypothetical protein
MGRSVLKGLRPLFFQTLKNLCLSLTQLLGGRGSLLPKSPNSARDKLKGGTGSDGADDPGFGSKTEDGGRGNVK